MHTIVRKTAGPGRFDWTDAYWASVPALSIDQFHAKNGEHRPITEVKLAHDGRNVYALFRVQDRYVRSEQTELHGMVCTDSCVEFFVRPKADKGYLNFEMNCGGTLLLFYIEDATRTPDGFKKFVKVPAEWAQQAKIVSSMPRQVLPEITEPTVWTLQLTIPVKLLEHYVGPLGDIGGQTWQGNFFKCGDKTSHPHWGSWANVGEKLNFHQPDKFGKLALGT